MNEFTIALIEDNADDEALTIRALKKHGIANQMVVLRDGVEAIQYLLGGEHPLPHLVLLDLNLPRVNGLEVLQRLRADARTALLPIVILTSSNEDQDLVNGYRLGANSYVRKPVDFVEFSQAVHQLGLYWLVLNQPVPR